MDESATDTEIAILPDERSVALAAANVIVAWSETLDEEDFSIALAGGSTPRLLYQTLGREPYLSRINWERWHVWWGDERAVPPDAPDSNYVMVKEALLDHVPIPMDHVHRIHGELGAQAAALAYENELRDHFGTPMPQFDLILLGIGEDGHTASLFPGTEALHESPLSVVPGIAPRPPHDRVTLTFPAINAADRVLFVVTGRDKAHALRRVIAADQEDTHRPPAALVRPVSGSAQFLVDEAAALFLTGARAQ